MGTCDSLNRTRKLERKKNGVFSPHLLSYVLKLADN